MTASLLELGAAIADLEVVVQHEEPVREGRPAGSPSTDVLSNDEQWRAKWVLIRQKILLNDRDHECN